jgi:hypothetical protein
MPVLPGYRKTLDSPRTIITGSEASSSLVRQPDDRLERLAQLALRLPWFPVPRSETVTAPSSGQTLRLLHHSLGINPGLFLCRANFCWCRRGSFSTRHLRGQRQSRLGPIHLTSKSSSSSVLRDPLMTCHSGIRRWNRDFVQGGG